MMISSVLDAGLPWTLPVEYLISVSIMLKSLEARRISSNVEKAHYAMRQTQPHPFGVACVHRRQIHGFELRGSAPWKVWANLMHRSTTGVIQRQAGTQPCFREIRHIVVISTKAGIWHARTRRSPQLHCRISRWRFRNRNSLSRAFAAVVSLTAALRTAMSGRGQIQYDQTVPITSRSRQANKTSSVRIGSGAARLSLLRERAHRYRRLRQYVLLQALLIRWSQVRIPHGLPRINRKPTNFGSWAFCVLAADAEAFGARLRLLQSVQHPS
jgi:hypothetical protein